MAEEAPKPPPSPAADLPRLAAAALALAQIPWIWVIVRQFREGAGSAAAVNGASAVAVLAIAAGLWMRIPAVLGYALIACWYDVATSAYWAYRTEIHVLWGSVGLAASSALLISMARSRMESRAARPKGTASPEQDSFAQWAKENVEAIIVAFIMALVIRCFCIEVFKIPSSSMEPTLLGDKFTRHHNPGSCEFGQEHTYPGGDRIMVTKYYYAFSPIERYDVVVFKFPLNQSRNFIKRVVGLPNETLVIHKGNLFVRPAGKDGYEVARRSIRTQDSIWIPVLSEQRPFLDSTREFFESSWSVQPEPEEAPAPAWDLQEKELRTYESVGRRGALFRLKGPIHIDNRDVDDRRLSFDFDLTSPKGQVFAEIENSYGRFEVRLFTDAESHFKWTGSKDVVNEPLPKVRLQMDRNYRLELAVWDGMAVVRLDGTAIGTIRFATKREEFLENPSPRYGVSFGARDLTFRVRRLAVDRDIYYMPKSGGLGENEPLKIGASEYVMMGDNVTNSHDSRAWRRCEVRIQGRSKPIVFELQEKDNSTEVRPEDLQKRYGLPRVPDHWVAFDEDGVSWALYTGDPGPIPPGVPAGVLASTFPGDDTPFPRIEEQYIVGKALWIWWPPGRWFRLIR